MAMGQRPEQTQGDFWIATERLAAAPAHPFYQKLNPLLAAAGFDPFCQAACQQFYAQTLGRPSIPPEVYFRMLMMGYFEKLDSEREIAWRCADSLALRAFLGYRVDLGTPDHSSLSRTRNRIDLETHQAVFDPGAPGLKRLTEQGLLKGQTLGIDASTLEADAALKSIVRRDNRQSYREFLTALAKASGIETPTAEDLAKLDRQRKDKSAGNDDWFNPNDPEAKIAKMKDGRTHLAYKSEPERKRGAPARSWRPRFTWQTKATRPRCGARWRKRRIRCRKCGKMPRWSRTARPTAWRTRVNCTSKRRCRTRVTTVPRRW